MLNLRFEYRENDVLLLLQLVQAVQLEYTRVRYDDAYDYKSCHCFTKRQTTLKPAHALLGLKKPTGGVSLIQGGLGTTESNTSEQRKITDIHCVLLVS